MVICRILYGNEKYPPAVSTKTTSKEQNRVKPFSPLYLNSRSVFTFLSDQYIGRVDWSIP